MWRRIKPYLIALATIYLVAAVLVDEIYDPFGRRQPATNVCSLEYRSIYLRFNNSDAALRGDCPFEQWYRPGALEPTQKTGLCDMKYPWYRERWLQAIERIGAGNERYTDMQIAADYCPYDGTKRICSIRRCRIVKSLD